MAVLLITYDLPKKGQNYEGILGTIRKYPNTQLSESSYAIDTTETHLDIFKKLQSSMDSNDRLYVVNLTKPVTGHGKKNVNEWLEEHLP